MATSLDDVLTDDKPEAPAKEPMAEAPATAPEKPDVERASSRRAAHRSKELEAQGRDPETGQFKPKEPKEEAKAPEAKAPEKPTDPAKVAEPAKTTEPAKATDPTDGLTPKEKAAFAAAADERRKRQALEQELARYRQQPGAQPQPAAKPKTFWDDPEGAFKTEEQRRHEHAVHTKLQVSEMIGRSKHQDFDPMIAKFVELARSVPGLAQQMIQAPDPGEFAYRTAKNHAAVEQAGGVDKLIADREAKARAEERAKVEAEFKAKQEEAEKQRSALTPSLSDATGAGRRPAAPSFSGPTPLEKILER